MCGLVVRIGSGFIRRSLLLLLLFAVILIICFELSWMFSYYLFLVLLIAHEYNQVCSIILRPISQDIIIDISIKGGMEDRYIISLSHPLQSSLVLVLVLVLLALFFV